MAWYQIAERGESVENTLLVALSITIASVPIALPMVMTITQVRHDNPPSPHHTSLRHCTPLMLCR